MNRYFKIVIATALISVTTSANAIDRKTLAQYASSLTGLKKEQLKTASGILIVIRKRMSATIVIAIKNSILKVRIQASPLQV